MTSRRTGESPTAAPRPPSLTALSDRQALKAHSPDTSSGPLDRWPYTERIQLARQRRREALYHLQLRIVRRVDNHAAAAATAAAATAHATAHWRR